MAISIKFTKFDNTPWGFRLAGGSDFPQPLTVIKVLEGSLAECMGLKVGDVVVRLNDEPISSLTHGQAHEALVRAGNNFVLGVQREADALKAVEALSEENIVPYKIPLAELPPVFPEEILKEETIIERYEEETIRETTSTLEDTEKQPIEELPDKPKDANSEIVPNQNLTDDEIAQLILEEEELLTDQGVLGVNFKKPKPRIPVLKDSKVLEELQHIATADPPRVQELKRTSTFLQKPQRPVPAPRKKEQEEEPEVESYKVVIKKQKRRSITDRLLEKGLLKPSGLKTPEPPPTPEVKMTSNETETNVRREDCPFDLSESLVNDQSSSSSLSLSSLQRQSNISVSSLSPHDLQMNNSPNVSVSCLSSQNLKMNQNNMNNQQDYSSCFSMPLVDNSFSDGQSNVPISYSTSLNIEINETKTNDRMDSSNNFSEPLVENLLSGERSNVSTLYLPARQNLEINETKTNVQGDPSNDFSKSLVDNSLSTEQCNVSSSRLISQNLEVNNPAMNAREISSNNSSESFPVNNTLEMEQFNVNSSRLPSRNLEINETTVNHQQDPSNNFSESSINDLSSERQFNIIMNSCLPSQNIETCEICPNVNDFESEITNEKISATELSEHQKNVALTRRGPSKQKFKRFYTRAHYFRRCLFGKRYSCYTETKRTLKCTSKERGNAGNTRDGDIYKGGRRRTNDVNGRTAIRMRGRYLETYLKQQSTWLKRLFDGWIERHDRFTSNGRRLAFKKARYAEKILAKSLAFVFTRLRTILSRCLGITVTEKHRYVPQTYSGLENVDSNTTRKLLRSLSGDEATSREDVRRLYFKGRYVQRILRNTVVRLLDHFKGVASRTRREKTSVRRTRTIRTKPRYFERCLKNRDDLHLMVGGFVDFLDRLLIDFRKFRNELSGRSKACTRKTLSARARYFERIVKRQIEKLGMIVARVRSQILCSIVDSSCVARETVEIRTRDNINGNSSIDDSVRESSKNRPSRRDSFGSFLRTSGDFISTEVFHRGSRRLSKSSKATVNLTMSVENTNWLITLKNASLDYTSRFLPFRVTNDTPDGVICEEKNIRDAERDGRRLSFVPTILYEGFTNRIGVDFTRLVAYAFVPCTSIILLYMYK